MTNYYGLDREYFERHFREPPSWTDPARIRGADAASFRILNHAWAVDASHVYLEGRRVAGVDRASFRVLNELFARDANRVFCAGGQEDAIADHASFETLDSGELEVAFRDYRGYSRDAQQVYFANDRHGPRVIAGADPASFVVAGQGFAHDAEAVYHLGKAIRGARPAGLEVLSHGYARTAAHVYYERKLLADAEPATFRVLGFGSGRDDSRLYEFERLIAGADPDTYRRIEGTNLARDAHSLFVSGVAQPGVDMATFEHLGYDYHADRERVYWRGKPIPHADRLTFRVVNKFTGRDRKREFFEDGSRTVYDAWREKQREHPQRSLLATLGWIATLLATLIWSLVSWPFRKLFAKPSAPDLAVAAERGDLRFDRELKVFAKTLAGDHTAALTPVLLAIEDLPAFLAKYVDAEPEAGAPDYEELIDWVGDRAGLRAIHVLDAVFAHYGLLGSANHEWSEDTVRAELDPMLRRAGVANFDWSFVDKLDEAGLLHELGDEDLECLLQKQIAPHGLTLVRVSLYCGESQRIALLRDADYARIDGLGDGDDFSISREFLTSPQFERAELALKG
jgi:hypothetical protein